MPKRPGGEIGRHRRLVADGQRVAVQTWAAARDPDRRQRRSDRGIHARGDRRGVPRVIPGPQRVRQLQPVGRDMVQLGRQQVHRHVLVVVGQTIERVERNRRRTPEDIGQAIVRAVVFLLVQVGQGELRIGPKPDPDRRRHTPAPLLGQIAPDRVGILPHDVQANGGGQPDRQVQIGGSPVEGTVAEADLGIVGTLQRRSLGHHVDHAARRSPPEQQRRRPLQDLDGIDVEGVAVVLARIAGAIDEQVATGGKSPDRQGIALCPALARVDRDAGNIAHGFTQGRDVLFLDQLPRHDRDTLRRVLDRGRQAVQRRLPFHRVPGLRPRDGDRVQRFHLPAPGRRRPGLPARKPDSSRLSWISPAPPSKRMRAPGGKIWMRRRSSVQLSYNHMRLSLNLAIKMPQPQYATDSQNHLQAIPRSPMHGWQGQFPGNPLLGKDA